MGDWSQPGPGRRRVQFDCGHVKFLPKETVYREEHHHGQKWRKRCRECRQVWAAEQEQQRAGDTERLKRRAEERLQEGVWRLRARLERMGD